MDNLDMAKLMNMLSNGWIKMICKRVWKLQTK